MKQQVSLMTRALAAVCRVCPFCICARRWPDSRFARALAKIERGCPACRAYASLHRAGNEPAGVKGDAT